MFETPPVQTIIREINNGEKRGIHKMTVSHKVDSNASGIMGSWGGGGHRLSPVGESHEARVMRQKESKRTQEGQTMTKQNKKMSRLENGIRSNLLPTVHSCSLVALIWPRSASR